jgi:AcrR family transcriptional regulator
VNVFSEQVQSRAEKREATHWKVLASAERLFRDQGFGATTVRQIAADAGVSVGTVMSVGDKEALLIAIFDGWIEAIHRERRDDAEAPVPMPAGDAVDVIMALFEPFLQYFTLDKGLSREYAAIIVRGQHETAIFRKLALSLKAEINRVLEGAGLTGTDAGRGARAIYFAYLGILMTASNGAIPEDDAIDQLREVVGFVITHKGAQE